MLDQRLRDVCVADPEALCSKARAACATEAMNTRIAPEWEGIDAMVGGNPFIPIS
jgi:hypothetical protein